MTGPQIDITSYHRDDNVFFDLFRYYNSNIIFQNLKYENKLQFKKNKKALKGNMAHYLSHILSSFLKFY